PEPTPASDQPLSGFLNDLAVQLEPAAAAEVLDDVPVELADVLAAHLRQAVPEREMDGAVDLLVEERVPHVAGDPRVAADSQLAEEPGALVPVDRLEEEVLVVLGGGLD